MVGAKMTANELADELENTYPFVGVMEIAATMLRQQQAEINNWKDQYQRLNENLEMWKAGHFKQQAEIEALKQIIDANNLSQNIGQFVKPTNKPVAWMYNYENFPDSFVVCRARKSDQDIPLYTHPYKPSKSEVDALLDNADYVVGIMRKEIEEWKRKYKDMHNLATQAMSKVHQLEKEAQEK